MIKILADDKIPFLKGALEPYANIRYMDGKAITMADLSNVDALLIRTRTVCNASLLEGSSVRLIATATIGYDHIDTQYCDAKGIRWANAPGCNSGSVQQYIASVLAILANRFDYNLSQKTIGIIGAGNVGKKVERLARLLGMNVLLNDPPRARSEGPAGGVSLKHLLEGSDIITLHVPLNRTGEDKTLQLINDNSLQDISPGTVIINTSRGEVVEENALKASLKSGKLSGTVLDVWENEPHTDPELHEKALIATPHIAGYSIDGKSNGTCQIVAHLAQFFDLPLKGWAPGGIPEPAEPLITVDCNSLSPEQACFKAILHSYNVSADDAAFRKNPESFEYLRGSYPLRREFPAYRIVLKNPDFQVSSLLSDLGFAVTPVN